MAMLTDNDLLRRVEDFLGRSGMAPTRFGREVMGEASLVTRLQAGRSLSLRNANRVLAFIDTQDRATNTQEAA